MSKMNIDIQQNASYGLTLNLRHDDGVTPVDITPWSITASIKTDFDEVIPPITFFTSSVLDATSGSFNLFLSAEQTWILSGSVYYYDILAHNTDTVPLETYRLLYGRVKILRGVTEP